MPQSYDMSHGKLAILVQAQHQCFVAQRQRDTSTFFGLSSFSKTHTVDYCLFLDL